MDNQIKEIVKLAEDFREFSEVNYGRVNQYYPKDADPCKAVLCHFSEYSDTTAVEIDFVHIMFHDFGRTDMDIKDISRFTVKNLEELIKQYKKEFENLKKEMEEK